MCKPVNQWTHLPCCRCLRFPCRPADTMILQQIDQPVKLGLGHAEIDVEHLFSVESDLNSMTHNLKIAKEEASRLRKAVERLKRRLAKYEGVNCL